MMLTMPEDIGIIPVGLEEAEALLRYLNPHASQAEIDAVMEPCRKAVEQTRQDLRAGMRLHDALRKNYSDDPFWGEGGIFQLATEKSNESQ